MLLVRLPVQLQGYQGYSDTSSCSKNSNTCNNSHTRKNSNTGLRHVVLSEDRSFPTLREAQSTRLSCT